MMKATAALLLAGTAVVSAAQGTDGSPVDLSASGVFALADAARANGDFATAEAAYRALQADPDPELRIEARFRLALMLADDMDRPTAGALELRQILDEKPDAARVRLELARLLARTGKLRAAERELRAAQAAGLPSQVEQLVRFYTNAINARKPLGGSMEVALAPDSNINRATRSNTLGTIIGDFVLDDAAREQSGIGLDFRGQAYWREGLEPGTDLVVRLSTGARLYREADFNDISASLQIGPQFASGADRITVSAGPNLRWFGRTLFSRGYGATVIWQHPVGKRSQLRLDGSVQHQDNLRNALQTAHSFSVGAALDHAFSATLGGGVNAFAVREVARDPGYSFVSSGLSAYAFREIGRITLVATLGYSHLAADARLFPYLRRRIDNRTSASIAATLRALRLGSLAPVVRLRWERNRSLVEVFDYRRVSTEFGIVSAF